MRISFTSLKVSIAGAKLSHLVKKNRVWDHGSMLEQAKAVFIQLQKFREKGDETTVKKYLTTHGYELFKDNMDIKSKQEKAFLHTQADLQGIDIIKVHERKKKEPDQFVALIKGKHRIFTRNSEDKTTATQLINYKEVEFKEKWVFVLEGDWWLLDEMKNHKEIKRDEIIRFIQL